MSGASALVKETPADFLPLSLGTQGEVSDYESGGTLPGPPVCWLFDLGFLGLQD